MNSAPRMLLVEDDPNDVVMAFIAFEAVGLDRDVAIAANGRDALDFLQRSGRHTHWPEGDLQLILMDLNMPEMNGLELLKLIKGDAVLARIPVVVLTTSDAARDREACALLGADDYLVKPHDFEAFLALIDQLTTRWLQTENLAM